MVVFTLRSHQWKTRYELTIYACTSTNVKVDFKHDSESIWSDLSCVEVLNRSSYMWENYKVRD
jgi:hypothetical protein